MKILHVIHHYHEGFGYQENWLAAHQLNRGHQVRVLTSDYYFPFPNYASTMAPTLGPRRIGSGLYRDGEIEIIRKTALGANLGPPGVLWFSINRELQDFNPDVVHLHGATSPLLFPLVQWRKKLGYKLFVDSHQDSKVEGNSDRLVYRLYYRWWRFLYHQRNLKHHVSRFLPITQAAQEWLTERLALTEEVMTISPLGVDLKSMGFNQRLRDRFRREHKIGNELVVVNAGKQYPAKRIEWVIDVVASAHCEQTPVVLVLVGSAAPDYEAKIQDALRTFSGRVIRLPFLEREKLRAVYAGADVGIWPGIPSNTIQEAMAGGCAVILPNDDIVGHLVNDNGIRTSTDTALAAEFLRNLAQNPSKLNAHRKASIAHAHRFSWSKITDDLLELYERF